jgi:hypothetical protein
MFRSPFAKVQLDYLEATKAVCLKRYVSRLPIFLATLLLTACGTWIHDDIPDGDLGGTVSVDWTSEDLFVYRPGKDPLWFKPSFLMNTNQRIQPTAVVTDGGSIPRFFWNIPGLSPWALGPAYVIHDYIFTVHRCGWNDAADAVASQITFDQSALVLAEIGKALLDRKLVQHDALDAIVWGVRTQYARNLWNTPLSGKQCERPKARAFVKGEVVPVVRFKIPPIRR